MDFSHKKLILAPLAGITDTIMRSICRREGADIAVSEMVSAEGIYHNAKNTFELIRIGENERPVGIQLFGANAEHLALAARYVEEHARPDYIDLNSGCPVPKVAGKNGGSALLKDPKLFSTILSSMVKAVSTPVTVKIRSGWFEHQWIDVEFARIAQDCGVAAIALHPRSKTMGFRGHSYWDRIALVKQAVNIPVIGNGDITDASDALSMFEQTGCDSVMIGRAAMGNPWIFSQIKQRLAGEPASEVPREIRFKTALMHLQHYRTLYGEHSASREMKKPLAWYLKGLAGASVTRQKFFTAQSYVELEDILKRYFEM